MKVTPIKKPLPGEHLVATWPRMRPDTQDSRPQSDPGWRLRLRYWAGRSLTREALDLEQGHRASHLAWRGRTVTFGIVRGLEVGFEGPVEPAAEPAIEGHFVHVLPGYGITPLGEDVLVPRALRVPLEEIPTEGAEEGEIPWAAVLVLAPAEYRAFDNLDPTDPCELDPSRDAFADERRQDASLLSLVVLPEEWSTVPELGDADDPRWRNRLAHVLFSYAAADARRQTLRYISGRPAGERWDVELSAPDLMDRPWNLAGLPLALFSSELVPGSGGRRLFLDRSTVGRHGGQAHARSRPTIRLATPEDEASMNPPGAGEPSVWRARIDQFAEHLSGFDPDIAISQQAQSFQYIPAAGLLPKSALNILTTEEANMLSAVDRAAVSTFFPSTFSVEAAPMPIDDLDAALAASAPLRPFDFQSENVEYVRMIVPLPQNVFDPELLVVAHEDPVFAQEVGRLVAERQDWRQRRDAVRARRDELSELVRGPADDSVAPPDRDQLEPEPTESVGDYAFSEAFLSPVATSGPWEMSVQLAGPQTITNSSAPYLWVRTDEDAEPGPIRVTWQLQGGAVFDYEWETPPRYPLEELDENGEPIATPLWRRFAVDPEQVTVPSGTVTALTLHFESGRIAVGGAGRLASLTGGDLAEEVWWLADEVDGDGETATVEFVGGEWARIEGDRLLAPYEDAFEPVFSDGLTLDERLDELPTLPATGSRTEVMTVREVGLVRYIQELDEDINRADDRVDIGFLKAQSNIHRIRQVMLGEDVADKLLISPAISSIIKTQSARATEEQLVAALKTARATEAASTAAASEPPEGEEPAGTSGGAELLGGSTEFFSAAFRTSGGTTSGFLSGFGGTGGISEATGSFFGGSTGTRLSPSSGLESRFISPGAGGSTLLGATEFQFQDLGVKTTFQPERGDVLGAQPIVGQGFDIRTLTIAKRFDGGPVLTAYDYAHAGFVEALRTILELNLAFDENETVPDVRDGESTVTYSAIVSGGLEFLNGLDFVEAVTEEERAAGTNADADTGRILSKGIRRADATILIYRRFEHYIAERRERLRRATEVLAEVRRFISLASNRFLTLQGRLSEERHDVAVARTLRAEEQARVDALNTRRDQLIRDEVKFLAFVRPRTVDTVRRVLPAWNLEHAETPAPVPACLQQHDEPPDPLRAYIQLFRHAPARWFTEIAPRLKSLNTHEKMMELLRTSQQTSSRFIASSSLPFVSRSLAAAPLAALQTGFSIIQAHRNRAASANIVSNVRASWSEQFRQAEEHASLGDVIDGRHGDSTLARRAAGELDQIEQIATCLHAEFAALAPSVRLAWVERYSQFDRPSPLRQLTVLPQYGTLPRDTRRRLQQFADWLFGRVTSRERDAFNLMNDLVRICLLLASHAPVRRIISGHVPRPVSVRPGKLIPLRPLDLAQVKVGMQFQVWRGAAMVARGSVEDLNGEEVSARVDHVEQATTTLDASMSVQFVPHALSIFSK